MNSLKFKKKEETSIFRQIKEPQKFTMYENTNFIIHDQNQNKKQLIKLQRFYRQPGIIAKRSRYDSFENVQQKVKKIRSLSLKKDSQEEVKVVQNSIRLFKRPVTNREATLNFSKQRHRQAVSPRASGSRKLVANKKLTILEDQKSIKSRLTQILNQSKSKSKSKFRVIKSTFKRLDSIDMMDSGMQKLKQLVQKQRKREDKRTSSTSLQAIKQMVRTQQYQQALSRIRKAFQQQGNKSNIQLLVLFARCMYNLEQYREVIKVAQVILGIQPSHNSQIYIMSCLSLAKVKNYPKSLQVIQKGTGHFPQNAQIFYYKGKIQYHMKKYQQAQESFNRSYFICSLPQTLICLADCFRKTNKKQEQIEAIDRVLSSKTIHKPIDPQKLLVRKLQVLYQLGRYDQALNQIMVSQKSIGNFTNLQLKAQIEFIEALCKYKNNQLVQAFYKLQDCLLSQYFYLKSVKMLIVLLILEKNFYEASRLCSQVDKQKDKVQTDGVFDLLATFVEGSINLVRRNFKEGIQKLSKVQLSLMCKQFSKFNKADGCEYEQAQDFESFRTVSNLRHLFMSYGLFCIGQFTFCQSAISNQRQVHSDPKYEKGLQFNYKLCEAILSFQDMSFANALICLQQAQSIFSQRLQIFFYRAVVLVQVFYRTVEGAAGHQKFTPDEYLSIVSQVKRNFQEALRNVSSTANNTKSITLYYKGLFHSYLRQWKQAIWSIEQCIAKSDDSYWRYNYTKAMILACMHSFQEAINQLSIAINLSDGQRAQCFLLRSKCLQIQSRGNDAFYDLQQYIALKPEDQDVHMYAGQLLFQNGAFQDALVAFQHKQILKVPQNFDVYLTLAETLFLTGKFHQAQQKMFIAYQLNTENKQVQFDAKITKFTDTLIKTINTNKIEEKSKQLNQQLEQLFSKKQNSQNFGKIFRETDIFLFRALIASFSGNYTQAIKNFQRLLVQKKKSIIFQDNQSMHGSAFLQNKTGEDLQKTCNQLKIYTNQIKYNIAVCYLSGGEVQNAKRVAKQIKISQKQGFSQDLDNFKTTLFSQNYDFVKQQVFSNENKLSQFLPALNIFIQPRNIKVSLKLCVPFPKVQPPQIFPVFDKKLLKTFTIFGIEGKPQAPWIVKQDNVIKFTQKIQYYSRLDVDDSESSSSTIAIVEPRQSQAIKKNMTKKQSQDSQSSLFQKRIKKKSIKNDF